MDPHAGTGKVPSSVAGSGISPSITDHGNFPGYSGSVLSDEPSIQSVPAHGNAFLPYSFDHLYEQDLNRVLKEIAHFESIPQLPIAAPTKSDASFYFLRGHQPTYSNFDFLPKTFSPFSGNGIQVGSDRSQLANVANTKGSVIPFDVNLIKKDFPILQERVNGKPLIWLDNAATTQKPKQVIDRVSYFYRARKFQYSSCSS